MNDLPAPEWIDKASALAECVADLKQSSAIGVDTEADSFFSYREKVCLIQVSTETRDFLIDPLAGLDLRSFGEVLADKNIVKVFHDGEYDVGMMKKDFAFEFANIFDTRIVVAALGSKKPGLASVIQERFNFTLDKKYQRSDWSKRPLTQGQIEYARYDTRFLIPLYRQLEKELEIANRRHVADSEFRRLERLPAKEQTFNPDEFVRLKGAKLLNPLALQVLKAIFVKREELAERYGVPPFKVLSNETLVDIARFRPRDGKDLAKIRGFTWKLVKRFGDELLEAMDRAESAGPLERKPHLPKRDGTGVLKPQEVLLYEKLRQWRKEKAEKEGFDSSHALRREALIDIAKKRPRNLSELSRVDSIEPWQIESYGHEILDVLKQFFS